MSFIIRNLTGSAIPIDDLGLTLAASADRDLVDLQPQDVALSADLIAAIIAGDVVVLDPLDGITPLSSAISQDIVLVHNDPHYRIRGGTLDQLDDVDLTGAATNYVLQQNGSGTYVPVSPAALASGSINLGDLADVDDLAAHTAGSIVVFKGDGTNFDTVAAAGDADFAEVIEDIMGAAWVNGTDTTFVYTDGAGTLQVNVNDVFLRNTGDTLDSGTLTIASGASVNVATGATLTIQDAPTNPTDATNKEYVDSVAAGLDPKESVRYATVSDPGGTYNASGGTGGTGEYTAIDLTASGPFDGLTGGAIAIGDRLLIKNASPATENGIYVVTTAGAAGVIERAPDQDGSPANEVSGGNFTFVENGTTLASTGWVLQGDGNLTLNTDPINWVQFSESTQITAGIGLSSSGQTIDLDVDDLTIATVVTADSIAFHDANGAAEPSGSQTRKTTVANFLTDLDILTGTGGGNALTASDGVLITGGNDIQLDITNLSSVAVTTADEMVFDDGASGTHIKRTTQNFMNDLDIVHALGGNGFAVQTAADTYTARTITVNGAGAFDGLAITNGDGVAANPAIGLDINTLPVRSDAVDVTDRVAVYNITSGANEYYTVGELAGAVASTNSFSTWAGAGNTTGDGSIVADSSSDTATLTGGNGINIDLTAASDTVIFDLDVALVTAGAGTLALGDEIAVNDGGTTLRYTFTDLVEDLDIPYGISANGIVVRTAADTYASRTIVAAGVGNRDGLNVTDGDGVAGNPTVGLDIVGNAAAGEDFAATDLLIGYNTSATANQTFTGQEIADGVLSMSGLAITTIGGQEVLTLVDTTRSNKVLSIETTAVVWSENTVGNSDWIEVGNAIDALSGYIVPLNATIVKVTMHTEDDNNNSKGIDLYIDGVNQGNIAAFTAVNGENEVIDNTLDINVTAGQKLRLRGDASGGTIGDVVIVVWFKWRG